MRQHLGPKKVRKLRDKLGLPIVAVLVRGGTNHRQDLLLEGGRVIHYWPRTGEMKEARIGWWSGGEEAHTNEQAADYEGS